jgi:CCR4-NOT transcription complex subunit 7/8
MDTEFPGIVARPLGNFRTQSEFVYQTLRCNVDLLKIIQLGITLADEHGTLPPDVCTWQFNFKFNLDEDTYAQDSIELLTNSGIEFRQHQSRGIDVQDFGELIMTSGLVLLPEVKWVSFHSSYDFGYFLKLLTCNALPPDETEFFQLLRIFFPSFYDIKHLMKHCKSLKGGLQDIADDLGLERIGTQHQAGSDSLLTCQAFFKIRHMFFEERIDDSKYQGFLFGLGAGSDSSGKPVSSGPSNNPFITGAFSSADTSVSLFGTTPPMVQ